MNEYNHDALTNKKKKYHNTSNGTNRNILRRLKDNDLSFDKLWICDHIVSGIDSRIYVPVDGEKMGWLGYFIGNSTRLKEFHFLTRDIHNPEALCRGMNNNKSIMKIGFAINSLEGNIFGMLDKFFKHNHALTEIEVSGCNFRVEDVRQHVRQLSLALGSCTKSLKCFSFTKIQIGDGSLTDVFVALSMHPQLKELRLQRMSIARNECTALATLLRNTTKQLQTLNLSMNNIDDEGIAALVHALSSCNQLQELNLARNPTITTTGWKTLSTLFEISDTNLQKLLIPDNNIGNKEALIFVNALGSNRTLKTLSLYGANDIAVEGTKAFSKLLCDTANVNKTYLSNHTLGTLIISEEIPSDIQLNLDLNTSSEDKGQIARRKILRHHSHFNVQPFFEWEFKVLPLIIKWFEKADACTPTFGEQIKDMKLSCMYEFIREFPMLYIEPVTRKEIEEFSAMEMKLTQQLEKIRHNKTRAMRRLL